MTPTQHGRLICWLLPLALIVAACDSDNQDDSEPTDREILVGTWAITGFADDTGDRSDIIANGYAGVHLEFVDDGSGDLELFPKHGPARRIDTTYQLDSERDFVSMIFDFGLDTVLALDMAYLFSTDGQRATFHTTHTDALNTIFGSDLTGDVRVIASKFGEDGMVEPQ